jgi:hypothetical protein
MKGAQSAGKMSLRETDVISGFNPTNRRFMVAKGFSLPGLKPFAIMDFRDPEGFSTAESTESFGIMSGYRRGVSGGTAGADEIAAEASHHVIRAGARRERVVQPDSGIASRRLAGAGRDGARRASRTHSGQRARARAQAPAEAARLGAFLEAAEHQRKDDQHHDRQQYQHQASACPRLRPAAALRAPRAPRPVHTDGYAQAQRNMPAAPNYLNRSG